MFDPGTPIAMFSTWVVRGLGELAIAAIYRRKIYKTVFQYCNNFTGCKTCRLVFFHKTELRPDLNCIYKIQYTFIVS